MKQIPQPIKERYDALLAQHQIPKNLIPTTWNGYDINWIFVENENYLKDGEKIPLSVSEAGFIYYAESFSVLF